MKRLRAICIKLRLDSALMLLYDTTLSVKQVMVAVGLNDSSHFARDFARRHGASPSAFRAWARDDARQLTADSQLSSRIRQQIARSANDPIPDAKPPARIFELWREQRAKEA